MYKLLSPALIDTINFVKTHGSIRRYAGGYWREPNLKNSKPNNGLYFTTKTIDVLVSRGILDYCVYQTSRNGKFSFPVEAKLNEVKLDELRI